MISLGSEYIDSEHLLFPIEEDIIPRSDLAANLVQSITNETHVKEI